jgi:REP element-mobilizing transposase RayT
MARKPRIHVPGGVYHVLLRGNAGQDIFFDDEDRYHFYLLLQEGTSRFGHRIHGFCLMNNHVHLAVQVGEEPLSKIMQNLSFRYTRWVNRKQKRIGHLFQGRYKAILVEHDSYLLELVRYIHLNPVRAKMVRQPGSYPWSGHRCYLGKDTLPWLHTDWVLSQFGKRLNTCRKRYEEFVRAGRGEGYRAEFHGGGKDQRVLGEERFVKKVLDTEVYQPYKPQQIKFNDLVRQVCKEYDLTEEDLVTPSRNRYASEARQVIGWLALKTDNITLTEVARHFGRDVTTLSRGVRRMEENISKSKSFARKMDRLYNAK